MSFKHLLSMGCGKQLRQGMFSDLNHAPKLESAPFAAVYKEKSALDEWLKKLNQGEIVFYSCAYHILIVVSGILDSPL